MRILNLRSSAFICGMLVFLLAGCGKDPDSLTIYTSIDQPVAEPILKAFEQKTGIKVIARYDTEATKSVGLSERLRAEKDHPQADVWWGNEIFLTINLATDNVLAPYDSPSAADVPAKFKDPQHRWSASGMRVRVIAIRDDDQVVIHRMLFETNGIAGMGHGYMVDAVAMARPGAGTTAGHVAALYSMWGDEKADAFFQKLHKNGVTLVGGNSMVVQSVAAGHSMIAGLTDNDDVDNANSEGSKLVAILPDQKEGGLGTLAMPCTVAQVAGSTHVDAAHKLIDYLLSKEVEQQLITAKFVKFSVRAGSGEIRTMDVDYAKAAAILPQATRRATAILEGRDSKE